MIQTLMGKKEGMTQVFNEKGESVPVTIVQFYGALIIDKKTEEKEGYNALKIGVINVKKAKRVPKAIKGIFKNEKKKLDLPLKKMLKEIKIEKEGMEKYKVGNEVVFKGMFKEGDYVDISGMSKGKGFQGVIKRHGFHGGPGGHGSMHHRAPGSVGASSFPSRVFKNQKMPGRTGGDKITVQNLIVEKFDAENRFMLVRGAVPGTKDGIVLVRKSVKKGDSK